MKRWHRKRGIEDNYGTEAIRTQYEILFEMIFKKAGIPYLINQVFCFNCNKWFGWESRDLPDKCGFCQVNFKTVGKQERGYLCRPDFLVDLNKSREFNVKKLAVIRIDGQVHKFSKAVRIADYHILHSLLKLGVRVFIIKNEELAKNTLPEIQEMVQEIKEMIKDAKLYKKYIKSKRFQEISFCPDLQIRKYNRN